MNAKWGWEIAKETVADFMEDRAMRLAAALAYYSIFSLGPLLLIMVAVAGMVFGQEMVRQQVESQLQSTLGPRATQVVDSMMAARQQGANTLAAVVGIIGLLVGASGVFGQLQDSLNTIWEVKPKPGRGVWGFIRDRFLSFSMVLGTGFLLLISMALTTLLSALTGALGGLLPLPEAFAHALNFIVSFGFVALLFTLIFKVLPDVKIGWRDVWIGGVATALLFTAGQYLLGLYLGRESTASAYGAAGSFVVILLWVYYASVILFFGAEFTQVYARKSGARIVPSENAVPVTDAERAQQGMPDEKRQREPGASWQPAPQYAAAGDHPRHDAPEPIIANPTPVIVPRPQRWQLLSLAVAVAVAAALVRRAKT